MLKFGLLTAAAVAVVMALLPLDAATATKKKVAPVLNFTMNDINGKPVNLSKYQGKVILIVNVASQCRYTPQYANMQKLYGQYKKKGLVVLAFPSNEFGEQEPGTNPEIKTFCETNYNVTFPVFSKILVKGPGQAPLYQYLTSKKTNPKFGGEITWNFEKFLINRKGEIVGRFPSADDPLKPNVVKAVKRELAKSK